MKVHTRFISHAEAKTGTDSEDLLQAEHELQGSIRAINAGQSKEAVSRCRPKVVSVSCTIPMVQSNRKLSYKTKISGTNSFYLNRHTAIASWN